MCQSVNCEHLFELKLSDFSFDSVGENRMHSPSSWAEEAHQLNEALRLSRLEAKKESGCLLALVEKYQLKEALRLSRLEAEKKPGQDGSAPGEPQTEPESLDDESEWQHVSPPLDLPA